MNKEEKLFFNILLFNSMIRACIEINDKESRVELASLAMSELACYAELKLVSLASLNRLRPICMKLQDGEGGAVDDLVKFRTNLYNFAKNVLGTANKNTNKKAV